MVTPMKPETRAAVAWLAHYRLLKNLTYDQLSDAMRAEDLYVPGRSLHLALNSRVVPVDRTQFRIEQFVAKLQLDQPRPKKRRTPSHASSPQ